MKNTLKSLILFLIVNFANAQKITVNADKYTIKGVGSKQTKFYTNKAFFNTLIVGDTTSSQSDPFRITTNARFDGRISIGGSYGTAGTYLRSSGNSSNPTWGAIDWSEIVNKPVFGNYLPLSGGIMTGYLTLSNSIRLGGVFENTWFGKNALISNTSGSSNVAIGNETLTLLSSHNYNVAVGATALKKVTASANTAIGGASMNSTTTGGYNVAVGISSLSNNLTGSYNVAVGPYAGQYLLGTGNAIFGGYSATSERTRQNSMFLGNGSGGLYIFGDSLANIGLGTTRPKTKLQLHYANAIDYSTNYPEGYGSIHLVPLGNGSPVGTASTGISFGAYQTSVNVTTTVNAGIHVASNTSYGTRMRFSTSNNLTNGATSKMIIDENGKVGIGNDTPAEVLDVTGSLKVSSQIKNTSLGTGLVHSSSVGTFSSSLLVDADVSSSANINSTKIGTGLISNTEFNSLDNVTENIQTQLNTKFSASNTTFEPPLSFISLTNPSTGAVTNSIGIPQASEYGNGYLSATDWITFNSKAGLSGNNTFTGTNTFSGNRLSILIPTGTAIPTSGSAGGHQILSNGAYGMMFGVNNTGNGWIQAGRTDASAINYNLLLNPNGGNLGIGGNPTSKLHVYGDIQKNDANGYLGFANRAADGGNYGLYYNSTSAMLQMFTNSSAKLNILSNGNVGIGTATPNAPLQFANLLANRKIVFWEVGNNDHQYYGFGLNSGTLMYQTPETANHIFYSAIGTTTSQQLLSINADQTVTYTPLTTAQINALTKVKGKMAYNSDTDKPVWCNGTVWRYADGTNM